MDSRFAKIIVGWQVPFPASFLAENTQRKNNGVVSPWFAKNSNQPSQLGLGQSMLNFSPARRVKFDLIMICIQLINGLHVTLNIELQLIQLILNFKIHLAWRTWDETNWT